MSDTPAQSEATADVVEVKFFDRVWHCPSKVRLSHQRQLRRDPSNLGIVETFLPADEVAALDEIDPDVDELDAFTDAMLEAMGLKSAGNS